MDALTAGADDLPAFIIPYQYLYQSVFSDLRPLYFLVIALWVAYLFYAMYSIADRHFTWSLRQLSKLLGLSPDLAGMTLLAFGNGAPDFFTAVFGAEESPEMILGSSLGSGLIILTVVFGMVLLMARPPGKRRAVVGLEAGLGEGGQGRAREGEERGVGEGGEWSLAGMRERQQCLQCSKVRHSLRPVPFIRGVVMYLLCLSILAIFFWIKRVPFWIPVIMLSIYIVYLGLVVMAFFRFAPKPRTASLVSSIFDDHILQKRAVLSEAFCSWSLHRRLAFSLKTTCWGHGGDDDDDKGNGNVWSTMGRGALLLLRAPITIALNLTILPVEIPEENPLAEPYVSLRFLHRLRCVLNPPFSLGACLLLLWIHDVQIAGWYVWTGYGLASVVMSALLWWGTSWQDRPRLFPLHVLHSFGMCILWIYVCSKELLACLASIGHILRVSSAILGVTVLAWGNSFGDLVADVATASNGAVETAVTAIFSGPIQNVLLTIGTAFLIAALRTSDRVVLLGTVRPELFLTLALLLLVVLGALFMVVFRFGFVIPRSFGFFLIAAYIVYLPCAVMLGLELFKFSS